MSSNLLPATTQSLASRERRTALPAVLTSALVCAALIIGRPVSAEPTGGLTVAGDAIVSPSRAGVTHVEQRSARAIIDWKSFNVAQGEAVVFNQLPANAVVLNRVRATEPSASSIQGNITATGRVFLVNPNGVVFGPSARVNVAGLVATTADILNADFMQGSPEFRVRGVNTAVIVNEGTIETTAGGRVALIGPHVENRGTITADRGAVILATGHLFLVDVFGDGLVQLGTAATSPVGGPAVSAPVVQMGDIRVGGGTLLLRRTNPANLVGTLNSVPVGQIANQAVVLPGGAVAFVGDSGQNVQVGIPTWLDSLIGSASKPPSATLNKTRAGGMIDASPVYTFPLPPPQASNVGGVLDTSPASSSRVARLAEFNRLSGLPWLWTWNALDDTADSELYASGSAVLYTTIEQSSPSPMAQAVSFKQQQPSSAAPATRGAAAAATGGRYCTVAGRAHPRTTWGCR